MSDDDPGHEIPGAPTCMMYHLHLVGGAHAGVINSFRPYDQLTIQGSVYEAETQGESCLEWVDDWTRKIVLHHRGPDR